MQVKGDNFINVATIMYSNVCRFKIYKICHLYYILINPCGDKNVKVKSFMARCLHVENLLPQYTRSIINYTCSNLL